MPMGLVIGLVAVFILMPRALCAARRRNIRRLLRLTTIAFVLVGAGLYLDIDFWHALAQRAGINTASLR